MTITKIKSLFYLASVSMILFSSCDQDEEKSIPDSQAKVIVTPLVNYNLEGGKKPVIYKGDTVRYRVDVSTSVELKEIKVMEMVNNLPSEVPSFSPITEFNNSSSHSFEFKYVPADTITRQFFVQVTETNASINNKNLDTSENPFIKISPKDVVLYSGLRLFNSLGSNANGFRVTNSDNSIREELNISIGIDYFMYNLTNEDNPKSLSFVRGWFAHEDNGSEFVKISDFDFDNCTASGIEQAFIKKLKEANNKVNEVEEGDLFLGKLYIDKRLLPENPTYSGFTYGVIKIKRISDDLKSKSQGGSDDDIIEMDIKSFNNTRFKQ